MRAIARTVVTFRHVIVAGWIAAAVAAMLWLPQLQRSNGGALSDLVAKSSPALHGGGALCRSSSARPSPRTRWWSSATRTG